MSILSKLSIAPNVFTGFLDGHVRKIILEFLHHAYLREHREKMSGILLNGEALQYWSYTEIKWFNEHYLQTSNNFLFTNNFHSRNENVFNHLLRMGYARTDLTWMTRESFHFGNLEGVGRELRGTVVEMIICRFCRRRLQPDNYKVHKYCEQISRVESDLRYS